MSPIAVAEEKRQDKISTASPPSLLSQLLPFATICLGTAALLFGELGKFPLFNPDEALYAEPAREMLENGDFITTYLNYVVRFTKPPLVIWSQALGISAFGVNEFAVRFFEAATGLILVAATYSFAQRFIGRRAAICASVALATAPLFIGTAREAITDMPLSLFMAGGMMCFFAGSRKGAQQNKFILWLGWMLTGLSVMTKGPVGVVLPVSILAAYSFIQGRVHQFLKDYRVISGLAIVSVIALPWFIAEITITRGAYFQEFILRENVQRFTSAIDSHGQPWWYHFAAMFGGFLPWSFFLPAAFLAFVPEILKSIVPRTKELVASLMSALQKQHMARQIADSGSKLRWVNQRSDSHAPTDEVRDLGIYCTLWSLGTLVFFSASVSKLLPYTMPAFPALAVLVAVEFEKIIENRNRKRALIPVILTTAIFAGASALLPVALAKLRDAPPNLIPLLSSFASYELIFSALCIAMISRRSYRAAWVVYCIPTVLAMMFFGSKLLATISDQWEGGLPPLARYAALSNDTIFVYDMRKPSVPFYTRRKIVQPSSPDQLVAALNESKRAYILTKSKTRKFIESISGCRVVRQEGSFLLAAYRKPAN